MRGLPGCARFLVTVFRVGSFGAFLYRNRLLRLCGSHGCLKCSLNLGFLSTHGREKHTAEAVEFGTNRACSKSFDQCFRLVYRLKSFGCAIREVQSFSL